jgi:ACR3 family arsenite efflux pump ArsB
MRIALPLLGHFVVMFAISSWLSYEAEANYPVSAARSFAAASNKENVYLSHILQKRAPTMRGKNLPVAFCVPVGVENDGPVM